MANSPRLVSLTKGLHRTIKVRIVDSTGTPYDLTGAVIHFTVKRLVTDATAAFALDTGDAAKGQITEAKAGLVEFYVVPSNTSSLTVGAYFYDVQMVVASKTYSVIPASPLEIAPSVR